MAILVQEHNNDSCVLTLMLCQITASLLGIEEEFSTTSNSDRHLMSLELEP
jgi:hypothetical protein